MSLSPSPLGTQLDPRTAAWLSEQLAGNEEYYKSFEPYLQGLAAERAQLQGGLATGQAEEQQLMQRGPQGPTPMESFAGRLAGGISQAIAPQMNGQALAEREIQGREEQAAQRHAIKLQRLMKINERMAERAEKMGDLETSAKLQRENLKLEKDAEARAKALEFARAEAQLEEQRRLRLYNQQRDAQNDARQRKTSGDTGYRQLVEARLAAAQREVENVRNKLTSIRGDKQINGAQRAAAIKELSADMARAQSQMEMQQVRLNALEMSYGAEGIDFGAFKRNMADLMEQRDGEEFTDTLRNIQRMAERLGRLPSQSEAIDEFRKAIKKASDREELTEQERQMIRRVLGMLNQRQRAQQQQQAARDSVYAERNRMEAIGPPLRDAAAPGTGATRPSMSAGPPFGTASPLFMPDSAPYAPPPFADPAALVGLGPPGSQPAHLQQLDSLLNRAPVSGSPLVPAINEALNSPMPAARLAELLRLLGGR